MCCDVAVTDRLSDNVRVRDRSLDALPVLVRNAVPVTVWVRESETEAVRLFGGDRVRGLVTESLGDVVNDRLRSLERERVWVKESDRSRLNERDLDGEIVVVRSRVAVHVTVWATDCDVLFVPGAVMDGESEGVTDFDMDRSAVDVAVTVFGIVGEREMDHVRYPVAVKEIVRLGVVVLVRVTLFV